MQKYYGNGVVFLTAPTREELEWERGYYTVEPELYTIFEPLQVDSTDGPMWTMQVVINPQRMRII